MLYQKTLEGRKGYLRNVRLKQLNAADVKVELLQIGGDFEQDVYNYRDQMKVIEAITACSKEIHLIEDLATEVRTAGSLEEVLESDKIGFLLSIEGCSVIDSELILLDKLYNKGLRVLALTHNYRNQFAFGCEETSDEGLTPLGEMLIRELESKGIILDLVHIGEKSFFDAIALVKKPPIVSHSNVKSSFDHFRNLTDQQIEAVGDRRGVIGINLISEFFGQNPNLNDVVSHIDRIVELAGIDHVGLGPDFATYLIPDLEYVDGITDESSLHRLMEEIRLHGYSVAELEKIASKNAIRVIREVLS
jgi:membrane dipeptidase